MINSRHTNTTKKLLIAICFFICTVGMAQEYKKDIEADFTAYLDLIFNKEFEKSTDYLLPAFFDIIPKAQMVQMMEQTFNDPSIVFEFKDAKILSVKDAEDIDGKYYAILTYSNQMNVKINSEEEETKEERETTLTITKSAYEMTFGKDNVTYNKDTDFFEILVQKEVCAISENGATDWKFLVIEKKESPILGMLLPKTVIDKL